MNAPIRIDPATGRKLFNTRAAKASAKIDGKGYSPVTDAALKTLPDAPLGASYTAEERAKYQAFKEARREIERRRIERAQRRAEELLAEYEKSGQGWFWEIDRRGAIIYVSPTVGHALRRDPDTMIGKPFTELFFLDEATALAAGHRPCFECRRADVT